VADRARYTGGVPVAEVRRSGFAESRHHGSVAVLDAAGNTVAAIGDITNPIFPRSANKPLQATGMLRGGFRPASAADLALIGASHRGEPIHTARVRSMLRSAGLSERHLRCPPDHPLSDASGECTRVHHNCSGKHAGMLLTCRHNDWPLDTYPDPEHPLQRALRATVEDLAGERVAATGVDGCGAPVFALSLRALARAFGALVEGGSEVADAMRAHPEMVSGTDAAAYDTILMRSVPGLLAKAGAEGVQAVAVPGRGAVAIKIDDGSRRALMPVLEWGLKCLGLDAPAPAEPVLGGGQPVGRVVTTLTAASVSLATASDAG
jgi:L-asparaginase II